MCVYVCSMCMCKCIQYLYVCIYIYIYAYVYVGGGIGGGNPPYHMGRRGGGREHETQDHIYIYTFRGWKFIEVVILSGRAPAHKISLQDMSLMSDVIRNGHLIYDNL